MSVLLLFAQVATDPLSGGAGWVGTGLLGSVLGWLLFVHLPNKDKQILGLIESRDKLVERLTADFQASMTKLMEQVEAKDKERRDDFRGSLKEITSHCEKEVAATVEAMKKEMDRVAGLVGELSKKLDSEKKGV